MKSYKDKEFLFAWLTHFWDDNPFFMVIGILLHLNPFEEVLVH